MRAEAQREDVAPAGDLVDDRLWQLHKVDSRDCAQTVAANMNMSMSC
jgi:hypothetical protein